MSENRNFDMLADTIVGRAADRYHSNGGPRTWAKSSYLCRSDVCESMANWLNDRRNDVISGNSENIDERAFKRGSVCTKMTLWIGHDFQRQLYTEVTKDGFALYSSAENMDRQTSAIFVDNALDAINIHVSAAVATANRYQAIHDFMNDFVKEEQIEKNQIRHQIDSIPTDDGGYKMIPDDLLSKFYAAQNALDAKKDMCLETPGYKALLLPGKNESIDTMFDYEDDFTKAVENLNDNKLDLGVK